MKQYYTLIQAFQPENISLPDYLDQQGIDYTLGAEFCEDLREFGFKVPIVAGTLMKKYVVLIEEHELSAIMLSVDGVSVIQNRSGVKVQNKIRSYFSWILD